ncbi:UPF0481 protein At3g47200-like isoform X1 [Diospyros lotus]|uniref:UPF0481 protein At3g47200-like isoform X1 n=1 Tax=Diospyros lotus TaxID=55363 RepID=UPI00225013BE|nr:UPF0481 protein At3g47200-like isoform X1 [Diospyros lotus]XP_052195448.1 UPF0481 protein At3g47200-like isoform X1 [Diospyros lotus]
MTLEEEGVHPLEKCGWFKHKYEVFQESKQRLVKDDKVSRPKIQRLPGYMGGRAEFKTYYLPKLIEIGPILHLQTNAGLGDAQKLMWTSMFLEDTNQNALDLCKKMFDHLEELMSLFSPGCWRYRQEELITLLSPFGIATDDIDLANGDFKDIKSWILFVDGCSVLQVLDKSNDSDSDPEQVLRVSVDQLVRVHQDLLLLENQIPFQVLKLLSKDEAKLKKCMDNFLQIHRITLPSRPGKQETTSTGGEVSRSRSQEHKVTVQDKDDPVHVLDHLRRAILGNSGDCDQGHKDQPKSLHPRKYRIGNIRELKAEGIRVKKHPNNTSFHPNFVAGQLQLPELTVDGSTGLIFLNLIAYEMCPDFRNNMEISSYVVFLSSLIEQPEDVKVLRSAGVLRNELASDKEVADLFNKMDVVLEPPPQRNADIIGQIEDYIKSKQGRIKILRWMDDAYNTYFRSPWTIIALLAAALGLTLTFIQTWLAIHPKGS